MNSDENRRLRADLLATGLSAKLAQSRRMQAIEATAKTALESQVGEVLPIDSKIEALKQSVVSVYPTVRTGIEHAHDGTGKRIEPFYFPMGTHGTGFFIDDRHVVTNKHVIQRAMLEDKHKIQLVVKVPGQSGVCLVESYEQVPFMDVVILRLSEPVSNPSVQIGDSSKVNIGDPITTIGTPEDLENAGSVTRGTITKKSNGVIPVKYVHNEGNFERRNEYLETSVNFIIPGNSGGPVFDGDGKVIGIAVGGVTRGSRDDETTGYVIPINLVKTFIENRGFFQGVKHILEVSEIDRNSSEWFAKSFRSQFKSTFRAIKAEMRKAGLSDVTCKEIMSDLWMQYYFAPYIERADKVAEKSKHKTTIVRDLFAEYEKVFGVPLKRFNIEEKVEPKEQ